MKGKYKAAFIIPVGSKKMLGEDGWEFESPFRLSPSVKEYLIRSLKLEFFESYLGIESYVGGDMKMSVIHDDEKRIESIHFQLYGDALVSLKELCLVAEIADESELFLPHE